MSNARIAEVRFHLLSRRDVRRMSVATIYEPTTYDRMRPRAHAINDTRMGTVDRRLHCSTCGHAIERCPGHPGMIEFPMPLYHPGYVGVVHKILRCICDQCARLLVPIDDSRMSLAVHATTNKKRFPLTVEACKTRTTCGHCEAAQPTYTRKGLVIRVGTEEFTASAAYAVLRRLGEVECRMLGFPEDGRPESLILRNLQVPPPAIRPSITICEGSRARGQTDLGYWLQSIVRKTQTLRKTIDNEATKYATFDSTNLAHAVYRSQAVREACAGLQDDVAQYFDNSHRNNVQNPKHRAKVDARSIREYVSGKRGRVRANIVGKRSNFAGRTVISPNCNWDINYVGVPERIARILTVPERVTAHNRDRLQRLVERGLVREVIIPAGIACGEDTQVDLQYAPDLRLEVGWRIARSLQDGDYCIINRQPTLHKESMQALRAHIVSGLTIQLPVPVTTPYNADFDGDEMNIHVCQSTLAQAEMSELMALPHNLLNAASCKPSIGCLQDSLLGLFLLTARDVFFTRADIGSLLLWIHYPTRPLPRPAIVARDSRGHWRKYWTGKQLVSMTIPDEVHLSKYVRDGTRESEDSFMSRDERWVHIACGEILAGQLCKQTAARSSGGIVHRIALDCGNDAVIRFVSDAQRVAVHWIDQWRGFSIGLGDCMISKETRGRIDEVLANAVGAVGRLHAAATNELPLDQIEGRTSRILSNVLNQASTLALSDQHREHEGLRSMVTSGSKGTKINAAQILAVVGQQSVEGARLGVGDDSAHSSLPCFSPDDESPQAHGFVTNSYCSGLTAAEFFFHQRGGREGLVDTAVKTSKIGYIQRKLEKAMESTFVRNDKTVRDECNGIVQFAYGGDGYDASRLDLVSLAAVLKHSAADLHRDYADECLSRLLDHRRVLRSVLLDTVFEREYPTTFRLPLAPNVLLTRFSAAPTVGHVEWEAAREAIAALCADVERNVDEGSVFPCARHLQVAALWSGWHSRALIRSGISGAAFTEMVAEARRLWRRALISPGESVGPLAAESIGEPCTQMTLNTFHFSGIASKNITRGIPRMQELIDGSRKLKKPSMTVRLRSPYRDSAKLAGALARDLTTLFLHSVVEDSQVVESPYALPVVPDADASLCALEAALLAEPTRERLLGDDVSPWVIRLVLARDPILERELAPWMIAQALSRHLGEAVCIFSPPTNSEPWVMRLYMFGAVPEDRVVARMVVERKLLVILEEVRVCGVPGISQVIVDQEFLHVAEGDDDDGPLVSRRDCVLHTSGTAFSAIAEAQAVDWERTVTNDVHEVCEVLGIEAASYVLMQEMREILSFDGTYVNPRHVMLASDTVSAGGFLRPMSRHGLNRNDDLGPLVRCSFEETMEVIHDAARFGEVDHLTGVTANIFVGQRIPLGTGSFEVHGHTYPTHGDLFHVPPFLRRFVGGGIVRTCFSMRPSTQSEATGVPGPRLPVPAGPVPVESTIVRHAIRVGAQASRAPSPPPAACAPIPADSPTWAFVRFFDSTKRQ